MFVFLLDLFNQVMLNGYYNIWVQKKSAEQGRTQEFSKRVGF